MMVEVIPKKKFILMVLSAALAVSACSGSPAAEPQGTQQQEISTSTPAKEVQVQEFTSITEFFRLSVPAGWSGVELVPGGAYLMANSEGALERYQGGTEVEPGDLVVNVGFIPYRLLETNELRALNFQFDASPDVFFRSLMPMFEMDESVALSEPVLVSLGSGLEAGLVTASSREQEGLVMMFSAGEKVIALVSSLAYTGEMEAFEKTVYSLADEVEFFGEQDALYGALLGG